ncbi:MAG: ABC transporter ATP-binding protein [Micromonosporaceae bacterium]|nr:ABC transporter ATP-binding protein [Micromonosporaceae bacterium]
MTATPTRPDAGAPAGLAAPPAGVPAIQLAGLTKRYGAVTAVDGLSLTIAPGEVVALLGPNGAGKSTTIDMILGLSRPDVGTVAIYGRPPQDAIRNGAVGAMLQSNGLLPDLTVGETLALMASFYTRPRPVRQVMERAGIADLARKRVGSLSGGQQQRVRFAVALVADPSLIILDEPTTGLDAQARRAFWASMREETARGRTVLFATHYLDEADAYADRIVLLRSGRVVADGSAAQVKAVASGRTIRATLPGADAAALAALPGVDSVDIHGDTIVLTCRDSDAALRKLLAGTAARDIEVTAQNLEDAFLALTVGETP